MYIWIGKNTAFGLSVDVGFHWQFWNGSLRAIYLIFCVTDFKQQVPWSQALCSVTWYSWCLSWWLAMKKYVCHIGRMNERTPRPPLPGSVHLFICRSLWEPGTDEWLMRHSVLRKSSKKQRVWAPLRSAISNLCLCNAPAKPEREKF